MDNWADESSKKISRKTIDLAKKNICLLNNVFRKFDITFNISAVPMPNGNIQFESKNNNSYFEIDFDENNNTNLYCYKGDSEVILENINFNLAIEKILGLFIKQNG